jgi:hypothetical protein
MKRLLTAPGAQTRGSGFAPVLAALAIGIVLVHAAAAAIVLGTVARGEAIGDWVSFYAAGTMARTGDAGYLYDPSVRDAVQRALFGEGVRTIAFPQPAFFAYAVAPLSNASFAASFFAWLALNVAVTTMLARAAWRHLAGVTRATRVAIVLCASLSTPVVDTLLLGQLDLLVLAGVIGCYALMQRERKFAAGAALSLTLLKPQVTAAVVLLLLVKREWRVLTGFAWEGVVLLLVPAVLLGPHILIDQARLIASMPGETNGQAVMAGMMVNVRGGIVSVSGISNPWAWAPPLAVIAVVSLWAAVRAWRERTALDAQSWAIALALPLLCSPHVHMQTMVLLVAAGVLYARAAADAGQQIGIEPVLAAYVGVGAFWLLSVAGVSLMFAPVLVAFAVIVRGWPEAGAIAEKAHEDLTAA